MPNETFPPARSALNLRLVLASGGALLCLFLGLLVLGTALPGGTVAAVLLFVLAAAGLVDAVVLLRRRADRAAAHRGADHRHDSLFE
ncbi:MAG TPA: hypothetical protein VNU66_08110 [Mycobacteriales bacterium]|nr:hypothetical protein [Mycobacteriales bacterium]